MQDLYKYLDMLEAYITDGDTDQALHTIDLIKDLDLLEQFQDAQTHPVLTLPSPLHPTPAVHQIELKNYMIEDLQWKQVPYQPKPILCLTLEASDYRMSDEYEDIN